MAYPEKEAFAKEAAIALRLRGSDPRGATELASYATEAPTERSLAHLSMWLVGEYRSPDAAGIEALGALTESSREPLRWAAAYALAAVHTRETLPRLARLLDHPEASMRLEAVKGFSLFANSGRVPFEPPLIDRGKEVARAPSEYSTEETRRRFQPTREAFLRDEASHIGFWKAWWAAHEASLRPRQPSP